MNAIKLINSKVVLALLCLFLLSSRTAWSQFYDEVEQRTLKPSSYFGGGLVINELGLGIATEIPLGDAINLTGIGGLGGWGWKAGLGFNYYPSATPYGSSIGLGFATASGIDQIYLEMGSAKNTQPQQVDMQLHRAWTMNLLYGYNITLGKKSKFVINAGYAIPLSTEPYEVRSGAVALSAESKELLKIMQPGGLILGIKVLVGIY